MKKGGVMRKRRIEAEMLSDKNSLMTALCTEGNITCFGRNLPEFFRQKRDSGGFSLSPPD
jgi:hypothetical protein